MSIKKKVYFYRLNKYGDVRRYRGRIFHLSEAEEAEIIPRKRHLRRIYITSNLSYWVNKNEGIVYKDGVWFTEENTELAIRLLVSDLQQKINESKKHIQKLKGKINAIYGLHSHEKHTL